MISFIHSSSVSLAGRPKAAVLKSVQKVGEFTPLPPTVRGFLVRKVDAGGLSAAFSPLAPLDLSLGVLSTEPTEVTDDIRNISWLSADNLITATQHAVMY